MKRGRRRRPRPAPKAQETLAENIGLVLPVDSASRKAIPLGAVLDYFPAALVEVAKLIKAGNDKHNPGQPLHWARGKSMDHEHCVIKHFVDRGLVDPDSPIGQTHTVSLVWRALALLQLECEANGAPLARGARNG
jgi:hypothetical protein